MFQAGIEAGLREPPVIFTYGYEAENGVVILPRCPQPSETIRIPVLMVDWADYDPRSDLSNPNNPGSGGNPAYLPSTPQALADFLNGPGSVREYFLDVSGGALDIEFQIYGWLRSDAPGAYLQARASYISTFDGRYYCDYLAIWRDALRDAVVQANADFRLFDRTGTRNPGWVPSAMLVYEGQPGLCSGTNAMWLDGGVSHSPATFHAPDLRSLVPDTDPNAARFADQTVIVNNVSNMPEQNYPGNLTRTSTWAHELGHALFGFSDYYDPKFRQQRWGLSGGTNLSTAMPHPAAWEKWLFMRWLQPHTIHRDGVYALDANEKPDGVGYDTGTFLHVIYLDAQRSQYLTIENRWFDDTGNAATRWAHSDERESGLMISLFDWTRLHSDASPQTERQIPARMTGSSDEMLAAFRPGDHYEFCFEGSCIRIDQISAPGARVSFRVGGIDRIFGDRFETP